MIAEVNVNGLCVRCACVRVTFICEHYRVRVIWKVL